jgi:8-oxo-dGTP diphosphatase
MEIGMRPRVCAAIIRNAQILMVRHEHDGRNYWTLPGGGVEPGEPLEEAVLREVVEETHLFGIVDRFLFEDAYSGGMCHCFLVSVPESQIPLLGSDPEEASLPRGKIMLREIAWHSLGSMTHDNQVSQVISKLGLDSLGPAL